MNKKLGDKIRELRRLKDLSQENMAYEIGMSAGNYGKIERGAININTLHLQKIARVLNVTVSELFAGAGAKPEAIVAKETDNPYGFATKVELEELRKDLLKLLREEFDKIRRDFSALKSGTLQKKK